MRGRSRVFVPGVPLILLALCAGMVASCAPKQSGGKAHIPVLSIPPVAIPSPNEPRPLDYPGIHNAVSFHDGFVSGSAPEGDAGFDTLASMRVKTIISVDGAAPQVDKAEARGMRYIHLPIGYNGFDEHRKLQLVRATRDAMKDGPVYIHCHHGKHRSAGAAAAIAASLGWATPEEGVERMKVSGTAPGYKGLYACALGAAVLGSNVIDSVRPDFPAVAHPAGFVQGMVEMNEIFDHLKAIEKAGWKTPADHPDLVPAAEAGRMADLFRTLGESDRTRARPSDFAAMMQAGRGGAQSLEDLLAGGERDGAKLSAHFKIVAASCVTCHVKYRD